MHGMDFLEAACPGSPCKEQMGIHVHVSILKRKCDTKVQLVTMIPA
jgi:hypothetical protein